MQPDIIRPIVNAAVGGLAWFIPLILVVAALKLLFAAKVKGRVGEAIVSRRLRDLGTDILNDVIIPDGNGGLTQLDHVILTGYGLLVVETKNYDGLIFGRERDRQWTQRLGRQSFRFHNPLHQNYGHIQALKALVPRVPVLGRVVFAGSAKFPKGLPNGVSTLRTLADDFAKMADCAMDRSILEAAWQRLISEARQDKAARQAHLEQLQAKHGKNLRVPVATGMLIVAGLVAVTLLFQ